MRFIDSTNNGVSVHRSSESSLVVLVKEGQHLDFMLMELKDSVFVKMNEYFTLGDDSILRYQDRRVYQMWIICGPGSLQRPMVQNIPYI